MNCKREVEIKSEREVGQNIETKGPSSPALATSTTGTTRCPGLVNS
jgi:hypothetical protein